jgi:hypothetical protein
MRRQSALVGERGMESAKRAACVRNRSRGRGLRYTKSSFSRLQADIKQTRVSDEVAHNIQRCLGSFKTAPVRCECQVASDEELGLKIQKVRSVRFRQISSKQGQATRRWPTTYKDVWVQRICRVVPACKRAKTPHHQLRRKLGKCENESLLELDAPLHE